MTTATTKTYLNPRWTVKDRHAHIRTYIAYYKVRTHKHITKRIGHLLHFYLNSKSIFPRFTLIANRVHICCIVLVNIMCEHEVDSSEQSTCMYEYLHVYPHACARLYTTFYEYHIIIYGQDKVECNHMWNSIQIF